MFTFDFPLILNQSSNQVKNILCSSVFRYVFSSEKEKEKQEQNKNKTRTKNNQPCDSCSLVKKWGPISKHSKCNNWKWQFKNVLRTLSFSSRVYEKILRYTLNLQMLIWKKWLKGQESNWPILPKSRPNIRASLNHLTSSSVE